MPPSGITVKELYTKHFLKNLSLIFFYFTVLSSFIVPLTFSSLSHAIQVEDRIQATANLNVRDCILLTCNIIDTVPQGSNGTVMAGSWTLDGYTWWDIAWDGRLRGFSAQDWLVVLPGNFTLNQPSASCNGTNPQIFLSWTSSSGATSYNVYRNGSFYDNAFSSSTYNNTSVAPGTTYSYFIRAMNAHDYRDSNSVSVTAPNCLSSPQITIGPSSLNFGNVQTGSCNSGSFAIQHVTGTATASGSVTVSPNPPFAGTSNTNFTLSNGQAVNVNVSFCPTSSGPFSGSATITSNASQNINSVSLNGTGLLPPPTAGAIQVNAALDGAPWTGSVNYSASGAQNFIGDTTPANFQNRPQGTYTLSYTGGGPGNSAFSNITPSSTQALNGGGLITFTLNFTSNSPPPPTTGYLELVVLT